MEWLDSLAGPGYTSALLWTFAALILLVIVLIIIKLVRSLTFGTFVAGGRNRKTRLAVMDATAVDSQRRLILVRRDDVEHLLLIGGPTDLVIERDIRLAQQRRPSLAGEGGHEAPARPRAAEPVPMRPAPQPRPTEPAPVPRPMAAQQPAPRPAPAPRPEPSRMPQAAPVPMPVRQEPVVSAPLRQSPPVPAPAPEVPSPQHDEIDESLMKELEVSLDDTVTPASPKAPGVSLDDEMAKLLGELSNHKR